MSKTPSSTLPSRLHSLAVTAALLERLEHRPLTASADQYRKVARQTRDLLAAAEPDLYLDALLDHFPAAAEIYENLRYEHAGLCRSPFDAALHAEMQAMSVLAKAGRSD